MLRDFVSSELRALLNSVTPLILRKKTHFGRLHLRSHSFGHYPRFGDAPNLYVLTFECYTCNGIVCNIVE